MTGAYAGNLEIVTTEPKQILDITQKVEGIVAGLAENGIDSAVLWLFNQHTTSGLKVNEAEQGLLRDYMAILERIIPPDADYFHNLVDERQNGWSHLAAMVGAQRSAPLPIMNGKLALGTYQRVLYVELDGPRESEPARKRNVLWTAAPALSYELSIDTAQQHL